MRINADPLSFSHVFDTLAMQFPVCMASDEFHFFPQAKAEALDWSRWDDFSPETMGQMVGQLGRWEQQLSERLCPSISLDQEIDAVMLLQVLRTLREQFELVRTHENQPTFYLTIIGIGLAEAYEAGPQALNKRLETLPAFIDQTIRNLIRVPRLFRELGMEMLAKQKEWLVSLLLPEVLCAPILDALQRLNRYLRQMKVSEAFLPSLELYERIATDHMGCRLKPDDIARELEKEIEETRSILTQSAEAIAPGQPWQAVIDGLPNPTVERGGVQAIFSKTINALSLHCMSKGLIDEELIRRCPVKVEPIPDYMRPVRSNAAYSMPPGYPPSGGTFFIHHQNRDEAPPADYRLLTAHETFPGHHLLDTCRWLHKRPIRRHIELPIFYEGWASFAEELMFETGFFSGPVERMLMAKRRFWRAMRGQVDFDIHMRRRTLDEAADFLVSEGLSANRAEAMVRRYRLKPGYQLAYTIGRRRFRSLYDTSDPKEKDPIRFARRVLALGEIGFSHMEKLLRQGD